MHNNSWGGNVCASIIHYNKLLYCTSIIKIELANIYYIIITGMFFGMLVKALHLQNMIIDRIIYFIIFGIHCKLKVYIII